MKKLLPAVILLLSSVTFADIEYVEHSIVAKCGWFNCGTFEGDYFQALKACREQLAVKEQDRPSWKHKCIFELEIVYVEGQAPEPEPEPEPLPEPDPIPDPEPTPEPDPVPTPSPPPSGEPSAYRGIPDPKKDIGFDVYADYTPTQVITGANNRSVYECQGSAQNFCVIDATNASFTQLVLRGEYMIFQGGQVNAAADRGPFVNAEFCTNCLIRDLTVTGPKRDVGHSAAVGLADTSVWLRGKIHGFGDNRKEAREQDFHGIKTGGNGPTWILDAEIYDNSGDSVQVGDASRGASNNVYIGGGYFHDNRENGVDIKDSNNIVVSGVRMSGFSPTSSDPGSAIVVHDDAFNAKIFDNVITDSTIGIVSSGVSGHEITGNNVEAGSVGFECRGSSNMTVTNNIFNAPTPVLINGVCAGNVQQRPL